MKLVPINIWDDYKDDSMVIDYNQQQHTFACVDTDEIPLEDQKKYLIHLMGYIGGREDLFNSDMTMRIELYDSRIIYPNIPESMHSKQWRLNFVGLTHKLRERYVEELNKAELPFTIYSES